MMQSTVNRMPSVYCRGLSSGVVALATGSPAAGSVQGFCPSSKHNVSHSQYHTMIPYGAAVSQANGVGLLSDAYHQRAYERPLVNVSLRSGRRRCFATAPSTEADATQPPPLQDMRAGTGYTQQPQKVTVVKKTDEQLLQELKTLLKSRKVVLFIKGSPESPSCGFSQRAVQLLTEAGCSDFTYIDVLRSERIRELTKKHTGWPTFPQLFVGGKFVGGCDVMVELSKTGELRKLLEQHGVAFKEEEEEEGKEERESNNSDDKKQGEGG